MALRWFWHGDLGPVMQETQSGGQSANATTGNEYFHQPSHLN